LRYRENPEQQSARTRFELAGHSLDSVTGVVCDVTVTTSGSLAIPDRPDVSVAAAWNEET